MIAAFALAAALAAQPPDCTAVAARLMGPEAKAADEELYALRDEDWRSDDCISALSRVLVGSAATTDAKLGLIWAATQGRGRMHALRPAVETLLGHETDPIAHEKTAELFAIGVDDQHERDPSAELVELFLHSSGIVRREATLEIAAEHPDARLQPEVRRLVVANLIDLMTNAAQTPITRGRAIEASESFLTNDAELTRALLLLSRKDRWFDGVSGEHGPINSVSEVIKALGKRRSDPAVAKRLAELSKQVHAPGALSDFDVWLCEYQFKWLATHAD